MLSYRTIKFTRHKNHIRKTTLQFEIKQMQTDALKINIFAFIKMCSLNEQIKNIFKKKSVLFCQDFLAQNERQYSILRTYRASAAGASVREVIASVKALEPKSQMFWTIFNHPWYLVFSSWNLALNYCLFTGSARLFVFVSPHKPPPPS